MYFLCNPNLLQNYMPVLTYWFQPKSIKNLTSVTGPFPRGHSTPVNPLVQLSFMSRVYNATQKQHSRDNTGSSSSLGVHSNYNFANNAATPTQTIIFDGLDSLPSNQDSSCSQDLAQLRLCNPAGCSKWTRNIQVVRGETFLTFWYSFCMRFSKQNYFSPHVLVVRGTLKAFELLVFFCR